MLSNSCFSPLWADMWNNFFVIIGSFSCGFTDYMLPSKSLHSSKVENNHISKGSTQKVLQERCKQWLKKFRYWSSHFQLRKPGRGQLSRYWIWPKMIEGFLTSWRQWRSSTFRQENSMRKGSNLVKNWEYLRNYNLVRVGISNFIMCKNHLEGLLKHSSLYPAPTFWLTRSVQLENLNF